MSPEQQLHCQNRVAELIHHIERFERFAATCLTEGSREYWRTEIELLEKRLTEYEQRLRTGSAKLW